MHYTAQSRGKREQNFGLRRVCTIDIYSSVQRFSRIEQIQVHVEEPRLVEIFIALASLIMHVKGARKAAIKSNLLLK